MPLNLFSYNCVHLYNVHSFLFFLSSIRRLVGALTAALGDIAGKSNVASAVHAKCLVCDKPVKSISLAPISTSKRSYSPERSSNNQYSGGVGGFYDKGLDRRENSLATASQGSAWGSHVIGPTASSADEVPVLPSAGPETASTSTKAAKFSSDFTIVRNSIDLPPIDDVIRSPSRVIGQGGGGVVQQIKQRIRAGAGGGLGLNYSQDSR